MTIAGLDSSASKPTAQQLQEAYQAGVRLWCLYMATKPGVGLYSVAQQADFDRIKAAGMGTVAFVSGNDDPQALKAQAAAWGVVICLDDEDGIRARSGWQQGFLDASGAGHYGNLPKLQGTTAPFKIAAAYPGGLPPASTWPPGEAPPPVPHGWQCEGTHTEFGCSVDRGWYDDVFATFSLAPQPAPSPTPPPVVVAQGDGTMLVQVTVHTGPDGNGQTETTYPWDTFVAATAHCAIFAVDQKWKPGVAQATPYNGNILVTLYGGPPNSDEPVWLAVRDTTAPPAAVSPHTHPFSGSGSVTGTTGEPQ